MPSIGNMARGTIDGRPISARKTAVLGLGLQLLAILRALVEVAGMFLLAQGVLFLLAGGKRDTNFVYQLFRVITRPVLSATRRMMPRMIAEKYIPLIAFVLLFWLWIFLAYIRQLVCRLNGLECA